MEDLSKIVLEERAHSEQFKSNFVQLKIEYDKLVTENQNLNEVIAKAKLQKLEEPDEILKKKFNNAEKELQGKDYQICSLKEKLELLEGLLKEKKHQEKQYLSKLAHSEIALEQARSLLGKVQLETSMLASNIEDTRNKDEHQYQKTLSELSEKCAKVNKEKKLIALHVIKATAKAKNNLEKMTQENALQDFTITKLKETLEQVNWDRSELSSKLEAFKVHQGQERGEMLMQIRNLECESTKYKATVEALEKNLQETQRDKERITLSLRDAQNNAVLLESRHCEMEIKLKNSLDQFKKDLEQKEQRHDFEIDRLNQAIHVLKVDLDLKQSDVQQQLEKLRQHEQRLIATDEQLRKKEVEIDSKVQEAKIETENKYRAILEDKFLAEIEAARRSAEIESRLILEHNLKLNLEAEVRKLTADNEALNQRLQSIGDFPLERQRLELNVELKEREKKQITEEFQLYKESAIERYNTLLQDFELAKGQNSNFAEKTSQVTIDLQSQLKQLQAKLVQSEDEMKLKIQQLENDLHKSHQKSEQYAKLVSKLKKRLSHVRI